MCGAYAFCRDILYTVDRNLAETQHGLELIELILPPIIGVLR
ncbi:MAG: hypothetical protein ACLR7U_06965 [Ruthenibacterium lactatiformans]